MVLILSDMDGVVWRGSKIIRENAEWLREAIETGVKVVFVTNNSTRSRRVYAERLSNALGIDVGVESVITSGYATAVWLKRRYGPSRTIVVGEDGLIEEMVLQGHLVLNPYDPVRCPVDFVVVGMDRGLNYAKLAATHEAIRRCGAELIATNPDTTYPVENGDHPGAGSVLAFLTTSTGRKPAAIIGKPYEPIAEVAVPSREYGDVLIIGDRCDTDIEWGRKLGAKTVLVLTGLTKDPNACKADKVVKTLKDLELPRP